MLIVIEHDVCSFHDTTSNMCNLMCMQNLFCQPANDSAIFAKAAIFL